MPAAVAHTLTATEKKTLGWLGRALQSAGRGLNTIRIRLATKQKGLEKPSAEVEFMVETSSVTFWLSEDMGGQPRHGAVVAKDVTSLIVEEFETGKLFEVSKTDLAWGIHPFLRDSKRATKAIAEISEPPRLHTDVKSVRDGVHDTVSYAAYQTLEHGPYFGGLTTRIDRPSVRQVSLAEDPLSNPTKHSAMHEILRVTRTILPGARAWAYSHFAKQGTKTSGGKTPHREAPGLTEPTSWAKKGIAAKLAFEGDVAKMATENGLFARVKIGVDSDDWRTWREQRIPDSVEPNNIPGGDERSAKVLRESFEAKSFSAMLQQKGLGTQLSSIDGSDPPEAPAGPSSAAEPIEEAIKAALAYASNPCTKTCKLCSNEQKNLRRQNLLDKCKKVTPFLSDPRFLGNLGERGFGLCDCNVVWETSQMELEIQVINHLKKELDATEKPKKGSHVVAMAIRLSKKGIQLPGLTLAQWKKCSPSDSRADSKIHNFMRLTSEFPRHSQPDHLNRNGGRWSNIKNLATQFGMQVELEEPQSGD